MIRRGDSRIARQNIAKTNGRFVNRPYKHASIYDRESQFILQTNEKSKCVFLNYALDLVFGMCYNRDKNSRSVYFWKILRNQRESSLDSPPVIRSREI